jgi:signal transduction histidine kinase
MAPIQVSLAVQTTLEILEPIIAREKRSVTVDIPEEYIAIVDELRLRQVLLNLVGNAMKYTPPGTPLELRAQDVSWDELVQRISSHTEPTASWDRFIIVAIRDWGPGIAPEDQPHLFSKFVRLDKAINSMQRGAGLGLYLCRQLTEAMGGYVWLESTGVSGEGCTFYIALPLQPQE